eukprot:SAG31_NODE_6274_length_2093_cov_2.302407_2_plen_109_part_00
MDRSQRQLVLAGASGGADGALALALAANGGGGGAIEGGNDGVLVAAVQGGNDGVLVAAAIEEVTERHFFALIPSPSTAFNRWKCLGCMKIISGNLTTRGRAHLLRIPW